jgi:hypothetical protein
MGKGKNKDNEYQVSKELKDNICIFKNTIIWEGFPLSFSGLGGKLWPHSLG